MRIRANSPEVGDRKQISGFVSRCCMAVGLFAAMAFALVLPTGAAGAAFLLVCSVITLFIGGSGLASKGGLASYEKWFLACMALYPALVLISVAVDPRPFEWEYFDNPSRFVLLPLVYYAIRKSGVSSAGMVTGSIAGALGAGVLAIFQWTVLGSSRPSGFTNAIPFGDIALMLVCLAAVPIELPKIMRFLRPVGIGLGLAAVLLSQTRGAWIAIPFLILISMDWLPGRRSAVIGRGIPLILFLGVAMSLAVLLSGWGTTILVFLHEQYPEMRVSSFLIRIETWKAAWEIFYNHPWFGVGVDRYGVEARELLERVSLSARALESATTHAHNDFLHLGATLGVVGILAYLVPLGLLYRIGKVLPRLGSSRMGVALRMFATGQFIFSLTQTQFSHNISITFFAVTAAVLVALGFNEVQREEPVSDGPAGGPAGALEPETGRSGGCPREVMVAS